MYSSPGGGEGAEALNDEDSKSGLHGIAFGLNQTACPNDNKSKLGLGNLFPEAPFIHFLSTSVSIELQNKLLFFQVALAM